MQFSADVVYKNGDVQQVVITTKGREKMTTAYVRVGTQLQKDTNNGIAGISGHKGYVWVGHNGDGDLFRQYTNQKWDADKLVSPTERGKEEC